MILISKQVIKASINISISEYQKKKAKEALLDYIKCNNILGFNEIQVFFFINYNLFIEFRENIFFKKNIIKY